MSEKKTAKKSPDLDRPGTGKVAVLCTASQPASLSLFLTLAMTMTLTLAMALGLSLALTLTTSTVARAETSDSAPTTGDKASVSQVQPSTSTTSPTSTTASSSPASFQLDEEAHRGRVSLGLEYFSLSLAGKRFSTTGVGVGGSFALSSKWAVTGSTMQTVSPKDKYASLFTAFAVGSSYALTGRMLTKTVVASDGKQELLRYRERDAGGLRLNLALAQYFFNAGVGSLSYSGLSGALAYEMPLGDGYGVALGAGAEHLSNGQTLILPLRAFVRMWLSL